MTASMARQLARFGRALGHPLRVEILAVVLNEGELSPSQLADQLGEQLGNIAYHTRYLANLGMLELRRTVPRRGTLEHYYGLGESVGELLQAAIEGVAKR